jgi:hypothetical protein
LGVERLEGRATPAVFIVTSAADAPHRGGGLTLRAAVTAADAHAGHGPDVIVFAIPGAGRHTIHLRSPLPALRHPVVIDGATQPGYRGTPLIELDGSAAGAGANGLVLAGGGSVVHGLLINHFRGSGVVVASDRNAVIGDYIGVDASGLSPAGNGTDGVRVTGAFNNIGGLTAADRNVIAANRKAGVELTGRGAWGNVVAGDYVGTDPSGFASLGNGVGVLVQGQAHHNQIGGTSRAFRNVVAGNQGGGVVLTGRGTRGNAVVGNFIGVDAAGNAAPLGSGDGVRIAAGAAFNIVGGSSSGSGNLISGNGVATGAGVTLTGRGTTRNAVQGNWVGLDATGFAALRNASGGIRVGGGAAGNLVGGSTRAAWNVIGDSPNASRLASANHVLGAFWYIDSINLRPGSLGGTFAG